MIFKRCGWVLLLLCTLAIGACSALKFAYNNLDTALLYWLDHYLDLSSEQEVWAKERIAAALVWHRQTQLPDYLRLLAQQQKILAQRPYTWSDAQLLSIAIRERGQRIASYLLDDMVQLTQRLSAKQISHLEERLALDQKKFIGKYLFPTGAERTQVQARQLQKQMEWVFPDLNNTQEEALLDLARRHPINYQVIADERLARQQVLLSLLRQVNQQKIAPEEIRPAIQQMFSNWLNLSADTRRQELLRDNQLQNYALMSASTALLSNAQRQAGARRLQVWQDDLRDLLGIDKISESNN